jgi:3-hydroxy-9,10-secoandrosta-1,3,5(10)-triene-9,17-dione monooxygenase reductase component
VDQTLYGENWLGFLLGRAYHQMQLPIREQLKTMGMSDLDFELLGMLSFGEGKTLTELRRLFEFVGKPLPRAHLEVWVDKGLLTLEAAAEESERIYFTEAGRQLTIQWLAFAKVAEMKAMESLDYEEAQQLKLLIGRVIQQTGETLPDHWRKENIWQDNNLWQRPD